MCFSFYPPSHETTALPMDECETFEKRPFLPNFGVRGKFLILKILRVFLRLATYLFLELEQK